MRPGLEKRKNNNEKRDMETTVKKVTKQVTRRKRKLTPEENRALNIAMPSRNRSIEAFRRNKGAFIVNDPTFLNT